VASFARGAARHHRKGLAFGVRATTAHAGRRGRSPEAKTSSGSAVDEIGKDDGGAALDEGALDGSYELGGGGACGNDDQTVARVERRAVRRQPDHRTAERLEVRHANQACRARGDHFRRGSSSRS
jgi:hypothetical protein